MCLWVLLAPRLPWNSSPGSCGLLGVASDVRGVGGCLAFVRVLFSSRPSSWPIPCAAGPLLSSWSSSGCRISGVLLSASAPHVVNARQDPSGEKWNRLPGEIPATACKVPIHHPSERCCPLGLETKHMPAGSTVGSGPG